MSLCGNTECFGLEPCEACRDVRIQIMEYAVKASGMSKEQAEKFFSAYGQAFEGAITQIRHTSEELRAQHLADKEAREKKTEQSSETVQGKPLNKSEKVETVESKQTVALASPPKDSARKQERPDKKNAPAAALAENGNGSQSIPIPQIPKPEGKTPASVLKPES